MTTISTVQPERIPIHWMNTKKLQISLNVAVISLAVGVLAGWWLQIDTLVQILPSLVPMQFNTALGFLVSAVAIVAYLLNYRKWALLFGSLTLLLHSVILLQYLVNADFGIDRLFAEPYITTYTPNPGRTSPNASLSFILIAFSVLALLLPERPAVRFMAVIFPALVFGVAFIALVGYVFDIDQAFAWGQVTHMALHTSICFLLLSVVLLINPNVSLFNSPARWFITGLVLTLLAIIIGVQYSLAEDKLRNTRLALNDHITAVSAQLLDRLATTLKNIEVLTENSLLSPSQLVSLFIFNPNWKTAGIVSSVDDLPPGIIRTVDNTVVDFSRQPWNLVPNTGQLYFVTPVIDGKQERAWLYAEYDLLKLLNDLVAADRNLGFQTLVFTSSGHQLLDEIDDDTEVLDISAMNTIGFQNQELTIKIYATNDYFSIRQVPIQGNIFILSALSIGLLIWLGFQVLQTRRKEQLVNRLYQRQMSAFNTMIDGLIVISNRGVISDINEAALKLFAYQREELLGKNVSCLMPNPYRSEHDNYLAHYQSTGKPRTLGYPRLLRAVKKNGTEFPVQIQITEGKANDEVFFTGVIHDLTELMASRVKLEETEALFNAAVLSAKSGFAIVNYEYRIIEANESLCQWLGYSREEVLGMPIENLVDIESIKEINRVAHSLFARETESVQREDLYRTKSGALKWGLLSAAGVLNPQQDVSYLVFNLVDIGEFKQLSLEAEKHSEELKASNAELEQFAYIASHDLKEPVRTVATFSRHLIKDLESQNTQRIAEDVKFIEDATVRMGNLIEDLLNLSRAGSQPFTSKPVRLNKCIDMVVEELAALIEETKVAIEIDSNLPTVMGDMSQLTRVFQNLIANAIKFRDQDRQGKVLIASRPSSEPNMVEVSVKDNGIGIGSKSLHEIFLPFKKLHSTTTFPGTGIGLSVVKKIIERHQGVITVNSEEHRGSEFIIQLPVS